VRFVAHGAHFEDGAAAETGHIQVDFGLDAPFSARGTRADCGGEEHVRNNVHKLVEINRPRREKTRARTGRLALVGIGREPGAEVELRGCRKSTD